MHRDAPSDTPIANADAMHAVMSQVRMSFDGRYHSDTQRLRRVFHAQGSTPRPKHFTDLLTFIHVDGRWQIISKVFHFEFEPAV